MLQATSNSDESLEVLHTVVEHLKQGLQQSQQLEMASILINLFFVAGLSSILAFLYVKYGRSLSNRLSFASNFILIAMSTMVIITLVKSSLALSLGLVGALSIVRFRTAIKEPEELSFLFVAITIGLGFGADQAVITSGAFIAIALVIWGRSLILNKRDNKNLNLVISAAQDLGVKPEQITEVVRQHTANLHLRRLDQVSGSVDMSFAVEFISYQNLEACRQDLLKLHQDLNFSYLDNQDIT